MALTSKLSSKNPPKKSLSNSINSKRSSNKSKSSSKRGNSTRSGSFENGWGRQRSLYSCKGSSKSRNSTCSSKNPAKKSSSNSRNNTRSSNKSKSSRKRINSTRSGKSKSSSKRRYTTRSGKSKRSGSFENGWGRQRSLYSSTGYDIGDRTVPQNISFTTNRQFIGDFDDLSPLTDKQLDYKYPTYPPKKSITNYSRKSPIFRVSDDSHSTSSSSTLSDDKISSLPTVSFSTISNGSTTRLSDDSDKTHIQYNHTTRS
jgi:hypothetical protein